MTRKRFLSEIRDFLILIVVGVAMTWFGLSCQDCRTNSREFLVMASFTSLLWIALWKGNEYLGTFISSRIAWIRYPVKRFVVGVVATIVYTLGAMYSLTLAAEAVLQREVHGGVMISVVITIFVSLFMHGREFLMNWRKAAIEAERLQKESISAQYASLRSQVNPHFLFNSLNALSNLIYEDENRADTFIVQLSEVYRYVLAIQDQETVELSEEVKFLQSYLYLQKIRFGDKLRADIRVDEVNIRVPPLAIQMLIENAIKHNEVSEENPLKIEIRMVDKFIHVSNNLQKKSSVGEDSAGVGLENIRRRYEMLNAGNVEIIETPDHFTVKLPVLRSL